MTWDDNYAIAYAPTDDPRVLALIGLDEYPEPPDYDATAPTILGYEYGPRATLTKLGEESDADGVLDGWIEVRSLLDEDTADRYARIFHGAEVIHSQSSVGRYSWAVTFDTPAWRDRIGMERDSGIDAAAYEVDAYLNGEVFFIGYAYHEARVTDETPLPDPLNLESEGWTVEWTHGVTYGLEAAQRSALIFEHHAPQLPELLDVTAS